MAIMAITQDGGGTSTSTADVTCYSCGVLGHFAGSKECTKPGCIAPSAPDWYRGSGSKGKGKGGSRNGKGKGKGNGKGNGKGKGKGKGNSQTNGSSKKPCWYFNTNGTCRQGDNCKFSHDGARGANEVSAATVQSITDKITNKVMDSMMKPSRRAQKRTHRRRDDQEESYSDDDDDQDDNLLMNTLKTKGKKSKRTKRWKNSLYFTPIGSDST